MQGNIIGEHTVSQADVAAVAAMVCSRRPSIVIDAVGGHILFEGLYRGSTPPNATNLIGNVATSFEAMGGGLWVGGNHRDVNIHDPSASWTENANEVLLGLGFNINDGHYYDVVLTGDPGDPLLVGVDPAGLAWFRYSISQAPVGLQPNGTTLKRVLWDRTTGLPHVSVSLEPAVADCAAIVEHPADQSACEGELGHVYGSSRWSFAADLPMAQRRSEHPRSYRRFLYD